MSEFYTSVHLVGNDIKEIYYCNGKRSTRTVRFQPTLFTPSLKRDVEWHTLEGIPLEAYKPGDVADCREVFTTYENVENFQIYGNEDYVAQYIAERYSGEIPYNYADLRVAFLDIETECEDGFPSLTEYNERVSAITVEMDGVRHSFAIHDFSIPDVECHVFGDEQDMLESFVEYWEQNYPDIVTGWNIRFFDIPYLYGRIAKIIDQKTAKRLSPFRQVRDRVINRKGKDHNVYDLVGVATMDYYELYIKFTYTNQESYSLNNIASVELGEAKTNYEEYDGIKDFYTKDWQKFMEYNNQDVVLVQRLDKKLKLMELVVAMAYNAKVNFMDIFSQVKTWDSIIYHHLNDKKIAIPLKVSGEEQDTQFQGAYVKEPIVGLHEWVVAFDLDSLYPHLIINYNMSPETKHKMGKRNTLKPEDILHPESYDAQTNFIRLEDHQKFAKENNIAITSNGIYFKREKQGFLPELMETMYSERKMYKEKMLDCKAELKSLPSTATKKERELLEYKISKYNNFQLCRKIQLNSAYGAIGNRWFRYYDLDIAEAITISGQLSIRWIEKALNEFVNKMVGTTGKDYVAASDTDSIYLCLDKVVQKVFAGKMPSQERIAEVIQKICEDKIEPYIEAKYQELANTMNAYKQKMHMKRESISTKGIWTAKKRYMLNNIMGEDGVLLKIPELKIVGIETARSSTPLMVRTALKTAISIVMNKTELDVQEFAKDFRNKFNKASIQDIAFPRSVSGLDRYECTTAVYKKGTPIAVKASLLFNDYLEKNNLEKKYRKIAEADKIKFIYLKEPNPFSIVSGKEQVIAFMQHIPKELHLDKYVNRDLQFEKSFKDPLTRILDVIQWSVEKISTLESCFE